MIKGQKYAMGSIRTSSNGERSIVGSTQTLQFETRYIQSI